MEKSGEGDTNKRTKKRKSELLEGIPFGRHKHVINQRLHILYHQHHILQIEDTGNLILTDAATGATLWESFARPLNVLLPTMKIIDNINTENRVTLTLWRSAFDPGVGNFSCGIKGWRILQQFVWEGGRPVWQSGLWNRLIYLGIQDMLRYNVRGFNTLSNNSTRNLVYVIPQQKVLMMSMLNASGNIVRMIWDEKSRSRGKVWSALEKVPQVETNGRGNWSGDCSRKNLLHWENECRRRCLANCSCLAYAYESNIGCMFWTDVLIDVEKFNGVGVDLFIRLSASYLDHNRDKKLYIIILVVEAFIFILVAWWWMVKNKRKRQISSSVWSAMVFESEPNKVNTGEFP
ncbi:hypothetical protein AAHA92_05808 [Salvia divinorum]|uniref:Apple domain-containing protein n=1 Tax=Salvia divinorum TaxID=28513 RepID=A0ABD1I4K0_SALDI